MKTNLKLVAGGVAGMLTAAGLVIGLLAWASTESAGSSSGARQVASTTDAGVATIPVPELEDELATTTPTPRPAAPVPALREEVAIDPFAPDLETTGSVRVRRLIVATGVERHEPTGASDELELGAQSRVYAFVDAVNQTGEPVELNVTFEPPSGETAGHVSLDVPAHAPRFRTWAWTRHVYTTGRWHAVVRAPDGHVLARRAFDVVER